MSIKKRAFTLIELLVVVAIIGILATLAIISLQQARANARDAKRIADVRQMQTALELYFNENNKYPEVAEFQIGEELISSSTGKIIMNEIPSAPPVADGDCDPYEYTYQVFDDGARYEILFCTGKVVSNLPPGDLIGFEGGIKQPGLCGDVLTDSRDGNTYDTVQIGTQCWMAENLAYLPAVHGPDVGWGSTTEARYAVYDYIRPENSVIDAKAHPNYSTYGVLYNWPAAMAGETGEAVQGICPDGWHLPTDNEWKILEGTVDSTYGVGNAEWDGIFSRGDNAGAQLKTSSWGGNNGSGFTALPAGVRHNTGVFDYIDSDSIFWSSSISGSEAWVRNLDVSFSSVYRGDYTFGDGFSVRCLKDN